MGPASALNPSELPRATGLEGRPWFPRVISLFSSVIFLLKKELSPISLSNSPFALYRLPVFLGKSPCFQEKTDSAFRDELAW
jgi:hypothetical protein